MNERRHSREPGSMPPVLEGILVALLFAAMLAGSAYQAQAARTDRAEDCRHG